MDKPTFIEANLSDDEIGQLIWTPTEAQQNYVEWGRRSIERKDVLVSGIESFDSKILPLFPGQARIICARPGGGKAQPLYSHVLTALGWNRMGDICVGDELQSPDGKPSFVEGVFPQGIKKVFEIAFKDGRTARASGDHLWKLYNKHWGEYRVVTTEKISQMLKAKRNQGRLFVPLAEGICGQETALPIDPYILGVILGDGGISSCTIRVSSGDPFVIQKIESRLLDGYRMKQISKFDYQLSRDRKDITKKGHSGSLPSVYIQALKEMGLYGMGSSSKFIPEMYLSATLEHRIQLLQGLIDTDGSVSKHKNVQFYTTSERLAKDVQRLAWSIGATTHLGKKQTWFTYRGRYKKGKPSYRLGIRHNHPEILVSLDRKKIRTIGNQYAGRTRLGILSVREIGDQECRCIKVSHPEGLYITNDYVVTHNTTYALATGVIPLARKFAREKINKACLVVTYDQTIEEIEGIIASQSGHTLTDVAWGRVPLHLIEQSVHGRELLPIYYLGKSGVQRRRTKARMTVDNVYRAIEVIEARHGVEIQLVMVDFMQIIPIRGRSGRAEQVSEAYALYHELLQDLQAFGLLLSQANRSIESEKIKIPKLIHSEWTDLAGQYGHQFVGIWRPWTTEQPIVKCPLFERHPEFSADNRKCWFCGGKGLVPQIEAYLNGSVQKMNVASSLMVSQFSKHRFEEPNMTFYHIFDTRLVRLAEIEWLRYQRGQIPEFS